MNVTYQLEPNLGVTEFADVLNRSTLAERRPMAEAATLEAMLRHADLILTARVDGLLVGVSRAITDFSYCTYVSDLAVDESYQRRGIGRELLRRTHEAAGLNTSLTLLASPKAQTYYPHIGMTKHESCWFIKRRPAT
jgi:GNAT superfamily N-acetyltransferase